MSPGAVSKCGCEPRAARCPLELAAPCSTSPVRPEESSHLILCLSDSPGREEIEDTNYIVK